MPQHHLVWQSARPNASRLRRSTASPKAIAWTFVMGAAVETVAALWSPHPMAVTPPRMSTRNAPRLAAPCPSSNWLSTGDTDASIPGRVKRRGAGVEGGTGADGDTHHLDYQTHAHRGKKSAQRSGQPLRQAGGEEATIKRWAYIPDCLLATARASVLSHIARGETP
jgi:hypothetical protein